MRGPLGRRHDRGVIRTQRVGKRATSGLRQHAGAHLSTNIADIAYVKNVQTRTTFDLPTDHESWDYRFYRPCTEIPDTIWRFPGRNLWDDDPAPI